MHQEISFHQKVEYFMYPFMYELENELSKKENELRKISYHADEANTDRELKEYLKILISKNLKTLPNLNKEIHINYVDSKDEPMKYNYSFFNNLYIRNVVLPEEITEEIRNLVKRDNVVYTNPDILLEITNDNETHYVPVELKSTKDNAIPGSSVQQINPSEWVVFIKHSKKNISITTGQYINSINSTMQFPDRSPRPSVSFKTLEDWNNLYRQTFEPNKGLGKKILSIDISEDLLNNKLEIVNDWQGILVKRWMDVIINSQVKNNEPWFNYTIRRFTSELLNYYDSLSNTERKKLKTKIIKDIKDDNKNKE